MTYNLTASSIFLQEIHDNGSSYDLYVYEVSGLGSTNTYLYNGEVYPNGILIPLDWRWPLEQTPHCDSVSEV
ncbi:hypothetical protein [Hymenobacter crusticola]|uniref:Uncharacterized protein n=1 Tax=Hymenobacter crusticola TaxID=1770526 RepID=A0A243WEF8_9BACT|nr:hypothetical protein [Hymenobacter crusticola]OUJ74108.1 hypothetical protein BXP70_10215 [Hymenobacter crusticola]